MHRLLLPGALACVAALTLAAAAAPAQNSEAASPAVNPAPAPASTGTGAKLIPVSALVLDKKGPVKDLSQADFSVTVDGKPQVVRSFARAADMPLTVGVVVDVSRTQSSAVDEEQKATQTFLDALLKPGSDGHGVTKAFVMQYARTAELLQDVTNSPPLLQAGLKQVGTVAPGSADDEDADKDTANSSTNGNNGNTGNGNPSSGNPNNGGYGRGPYGRNSGNTGSSSNVTRRRTGAVLYDSIFLATGDVQSHQPGRRVLVLLSDGVDRHSKESLTEALEAAQRADTVVYAIYVKSVDRNTGMTSRFPGGGGGGYNPYGYPRQNYPGGNGSPGGDGTYADPDGRKILERLCGETGGHMFEAKGKDALDKIYAQIIAELRAGYMLDLAPSTEVAGPGYHKLQVSLTRPELKKNDLQIRDGYYAGPAPAR